MSLSVKKTIFKTLKIAGITVVSIIVLLFALPWLFPQTVSNKIKQFANGSINGKLDFSKTSLSFFKHFPNLTLTLYDLDLHGSAPFDKDTLVAAKEVSFGIDLSTLFEKKLTINKVFLSDAFINIQSDSLGRINYNVYKGKGNKPAAADTGSASLGINQILIENSRLVYNDRSLPMKFVARGITYSGKGDLTKDVFDLYTHTEMKSVDFYYYDVPYVLNKKLNADLITEINTKSLAFFFQKNDLLLNKLPVNFIGKFAFLKNGYSMDFAINSEDSQLQDIVTALPPEYLKKLDNTDIKGTGNIKLKLAGLYNAADSTLPDLSLSVKIRNGYIYNKKSPAPISNLYMDFNTQLPGLDPDSLQVNLDTLHLNMGKDYINSVMHIKGATNPHIYAKLNAELDLEKWNQAFGVKQVSLKGQYALHLLANGRYATAITHDKKHKKADTIITSIPKFAVASTFSNGYIKYADVPEAVKNISFNMNASCPDNKYEHTSFSIENFNADVLENFIKGHFKLTAAPGFPMNLAMQSKFNLADIKKVYPIEKFGVSLAGNLTADLQTNGRYLPAKKVFPVTKINIALQNGQIKTKYYPHPIENIQVNTNIANSTGTLAGMEVLIKPVSFTFEGKPFTVRADLRNFDNIAYKIASSGTLDVGRIYQVFAVKDYNVRGLIKTKLSLNGKQSDAMAGNYAKLHNSGSMEVKNLSITSKLFPKPFLINSGLFSFKDDKMMFDAFTATYGKSVITLNGALSNVIEYATKPGSVLKGEMNFGSPGIVADDFMAFASASPTQSGHPGSATSGVIMVPKTLDLNFTADVKKVQYNGVELTDAKGQMAISNGNIVLKQTGFTIIGTPVVMDASYSAQSEKKATFDYHINAKNFDIKRAYNEIKLFRDMATSAKSAQGLVSLDYKLSGRLNANMQPVYPSLKGGGVLSAEKVQFRGFKMFGSVSKATDHKIDTGDAKKVNIETTIANNIITIKQTKMRMAGFRLKFSGQVSFDNKLNLQFRLGLPPLGIFGIPMTITGTEENPKIKMGKAKKDDEIKETEDTE